MTGLGLSLASGLDALAARSLAWHWRRPARAASAQALASRELHLATRLSRLAEQVAQLSEAELFPEPRLLTLTNADSSARLCWSVPWPRWPALDNVHSPASAQLTRRLRSLAEQGCPQLAVRFGRPAQARGAVVVVHGWLGASAARLQWQRPAAALAALGLESWLFTLPGHAHPLRWPEFPYRRPEHNLRALVAGIHALRELLGALTQRHGVEPGLVATSLGAVFGAAVATTGTPLRWLLLDRPLDSLARPWQQRESERAAQLEAIYGGVNACSRRRVTDAPLVVLAGERDQLAPLAGAERLTAHLGAQLRLFPGGHLCPVGHAPLLRDELTRLTRERCC